MGSVKVEVEATFSSVFFAIVVMLAQGGCADDAGTPEMSTSSETGSGDSGSEDNTQSTESDTGDTTDTGTGGGTSTGTGDTTDTGSVDTGTGSASDTGTGSASDTGTGSASDTGTGSASDTGTGSASDTGTGSASDTGTGSSLDTETYTGDTQSSMDSDASAILLHHSTGEDIWLGGVPEWIEDYNSAYSKEYYVTQRTFPSGMDNKPYDYWNIWVNHAGASPYSGNDTLEILTQGYDVVIWKHCFTTAGAIVADSGPANVASSTDFMPQNFKLQYEALKQKMHSFQNNRFLVWTLPTGLDGNFSGEERPTLARDFAHWVRDEWDEPGDNIYIWDFFTLETEGGLYMNPDYAQGEYDPHPNEEFAKTVAPYLARRLVDVIEGRGDIGSKTGE